ncbi:MAG: high-potential iron-sulfur protein [Granulosicoccus sp.]
MTDIKRRKFVTLMGASATVIPVSALVASLPSHAADAVDPESAQAKALQYVAETTNPEQNCSNCTLYSGADGDAMGPCPLFPGAAVLSNAWCSAWVPKA